MKLLEAYTDNVEIGKVQIHITLQGMKDALKVAETLDKLQGEDITIRADKVRQRRSLNANAYFYELCGKIAEYIDSSKDEVHNKMLCRYGQYLRDKDDNITFYMLKADADYENFETLHLKPTGKTENRNGVLYAWYAVMKPSHEYDSREMAKLIDGTVSECKELGIETLSEDEIRRIESNG